MTFDSRRATRIKELAAWFAGDERTETVRVRCFEHIRMHDDDWAISQELADRGAIMGFSRERLAVFDFWPPVGAEFDLTLLDGELIRIGNVVLPKGDDE